MQMSLKFPYDYCLQVGANAGYNTYSPSSRSHQNLYKKNSGDKTPKGRHRSFANADSKTRPLRKVGNS